MFDQLRDLLFTPVCLGCAAISQHVCARCLTGINPLTSHDLCGLERVTAASAYGGWLRDALIDYKNGSRRHAYGLAQVVHRLMLTIQEPEPITFVPMPSSPVKVAQRGFDTIGLLLQEAMKIQPRPRGSVRQALQLTREVADQVGLSAAERQKNVDRSMTVTQEMTGTILLLDDVITTGSTMCEAARVLHLAGAKKVFGISLCGSSKWG